MKRQFLSIVAALLCMVTASYGQSRAINSDFKAVKAPKSETYFKCVGAGRANEGLRADWQQHMRDVQENFPYEYIRFHGLLHDDMGVVTENPLKEGELLYNFQYIDALYDFLLSVNIKPFVELSFMPSVLKSGDQTVFWWKGNVTPPKSHDAWGELIDKLVRHLTKRYGEEEVKTWYFEVWNEPNHPAFFSGKKDDYLKIYSVTANAIKNVNPDYRVGGPATAGNGWVPDIINYCNENGVALDFIATHTYGVWGALDEFGVKQLKLSPYPNSVSTDVNRIRKKMEELGKKDMELHYTEWSSSYSPRDLTHDTYLNAPYVLNALRKVNNAAQSMSYWTFTDVFEESGIPTKPLHGGFGLINQQGFRKPTYFAYKYLYQLGENELDNSDEDSWVCKNDDGSVQILAYNLTLPKYEKGDHNNKLFGQIRVPNNIDPINLNIANMPNGQYRIEVYKTGYENNDIQTAYYKMGAPDQLYPAQEETLRLSSKDKAVEVDVVEIKNGKFSKQLPMRENDIFFVKLTPLF